MESMTHVPTRVAVLFDPALFARIEEHRRAQPRIPNMAETVRRLAEQALASTDDSTTKPRDAARKQRGKS